MHTTVVRLLTISILNNQVTFEFFSFEVLIKFLYSYKNQGSFRDFRIVEITFLNGYLYCGINNGAVLVLKRLTLTPIHIFSAHVHQLHNLCPLTFETRLTVVNRQLKPHNEYLKNLASAKNFSISYTNTISTSTVVKKTQHLLVSLGRALTPIHEDIYLSSSRYRIDALRKYANCLILCSWNCGEK